MRAARTEQDPYFTQHFPKSDAEAAAWTPLVMRVALHAKVLCVARTRIEGKWAAYCGPVPGLKHAAEVDIVLDDGAKLPEPVARLLFPFFNGVPYAY